MTKSTMSYWNALTQENKDRWTPIEGLEEMAEELTLSIDPVTGEYTRLTRFLDNVAGFDDLGLDAAEIRHRGRFGQGRQDVHHTEGGRKGEAGEGSRHRLAGKRIPTPKKFLLLVAVFTTRRLIYGLTPDIMQAVLLANFMGHSKQM